MPRAPERLETGHEAAGKEGARCGWSPRAEGTDRSHAGAGGERPLGAGDRGFLSRRSALEAVSLAKTRRPSPGRGGLSREHPAAPGSCQRGPYSVATFVEHPETWQVSGRWALLQGQAATRQGRAALRAPVCGGFRAHRRVGLGSRGLGGAPLGQPRGSGRSRPALPAEEGAGPGQLCVWGSSSPSPCLCFLICIMGVGFYDCHED